MQEPGAVPEHDRADPGVDPVRGKAEASERQTDACAPDVAQEGQVRSMDERDKRRVGEQIEPGGRPKAPGRLETLQRFVNTFNHDFPPAWDRLGSPTKARTWLLQKRLVSSPVRITHADVIRLREVREAIRALVNANHGGTVTPDALETLRREGAR